MQNTLTIEDKDGSTVKLHSGGVIRGICTSCDTIIYCTRNEGAMVCPHCLSATEWQWCTLQLAFLPEHDRKYMGFDVMLNNPVSAPGTVSADIPVGSRPPDLMANRGACDASQVPPTIFQRAWISVSTSLFKKRKTTVEQRTDSGRTAAQQRQHCAILAQDEAKTEPTRLTENMRKISTRKYDLIGDDEDTPAL